MADSWFRQTVFFVNITVSDQSGMYAKINRIGQGTYGVVYRAQDVDTREIVAVKRIKLETREEGIPSTSIREIALLKEINHKNVIKLHNVVHSQHRLTLVFEYCDWDLRRFMQSRDELTDEDIISFSYQMLCALEFIHSKKIIHRDVKPQNLLINRKNELKLCDFGLARSLYIPGGQLSLEVITQWYRPPEILVGITEYTEAVDIWSAGCVVVEMITGQPLFQCSSNEEHLEKLVMIYGSQHIGDVFGYKYPEIVEGTGLGPYIENKSQEMQDLVKNLLEVDPKKRISAEKALLMPVFDKVREIPAK